MRQGFRRPRPATIVALVALLAALTGSAYAAGRIDGRSIRVKSLPGNRLKLGSVPANRLKPGVLANRLSEPITGSQIDERSLGQVPSAVNAVDATTVNGHGAGCLAGTTPFAGACWQTSANETPVTAPVAAAACAAQGGTLPEALELAAFAQQPDITLSSDEWAGDIPAVSGINLYAVVTVSPTGAIGYSLSTDTRTYRCVIPIVV